MDDFFRRSVVIKGKPVRAIVPEERGDNWIPVKAMLIANSSLLITGLPTTPFALPGRIFPG